MPALDEPFHTVTLDDGGNPIEARHYPAAGAEKGAIWVGGVGGGFDTPARGLYPRLCEDLAGHGIQSLRVRFRFPTKLDEAVLDVLAGLDFLEKQGVRQAAVIGHSFGGAVALQAASARPDLVRTVVTLATQGFGADVAHGLTIPLLFVHGEADEVLSPDCSLYVHRIAPEPKKLVLMPGASHCLDETAEAVCREVSDWLKERLSP